MSKPATETLSVVVEREVPFPPEKVWRAITQPNLMEEWLMKNDFKPIVGHRFNLRADWGVVDCQVLAVEPNKTLAYSWVPMVSRASGIGAGRLRSVNALLELRELRSSIGRRQRQVALRGRGNGLLAFARQRVAHELARQPGDRSREVDQ